MVISQKWSKIKIVNHSKTKPQQIIFFKFLLSGKIIHLYPSAGKIRRSYPDGLPGFLFMAFVLTSGFCNKSSAGQIMTKEYIKLLLFQMISEFFTEISIELLNLTLIRFQANAFGRFIFWFSAEESFE